MVAVRNKFNTVSETSKRHILNDKYGNCVCAHMEAAEAECMPSKARAKCRVP